MIKKQWKKSVASQWHLFMPPLRPSLSELRIIEKKLIDGKKKNKEFKVAILGSTPEYRDLCRDYDINYKCIEYDRNNFIKLGKYMRRKDSETNLIVSDWRRMDFKDKFDIFLGDHVLAVISIKDYNNLFSNIRKHCFPNAKVILKTAIRENNKKLSYKTIFDLYRKKYYYLNPFAANWFNIVMAEYDFQNDSFSCKQSIKALNNAYKNGVCNYYEYNEITKRWKVLGEFKMTIPNNKDLISKIKKYFKKVVLIHSKDWFTKQFPLIIFEK